MIPMIRPDQLIRSFRNALRGVGVVFTHEQSFRLQVAAGAAVLLAAWAFQVSKTEWIVLILLIAAVLTLELINSVFERLADAFKPRLHPVVRDVKDMTAGMVLLGSVAAAAIGAFIFLPRILPLLGW